MISVVIPFMAKDQYPEKLNNCIGWLDRQTAKHETIVVEHDVERYIRLNELKVAGVEFSSGKYIWFCDADFLNDDDTFLERMVEKIECGFDVILPTYISPSYGKLKVTDGAEFIKRDVFDKFNLNIKHIGISRATMPFVWWCLNNLRWYVSEEFMVTVDHSGRHRANVHYPTLNECTPYYKKVVEFFKKRGLWLNS